LIQEKEKPMREEKTIPSIKSQRLLTFGILLTLSAVPAVFTATAVLAVDPYPSKPVRPIIPFPPGGANDIIARLIATDLSERLGRQVVVEYRSGAGGIIGTEVAAKADPDGYTQFPCAGKFTIQPALENLPYDPVKSFIPIAKLGGASYALVVNPSVPANSVKELITLAKQKPGQLIFVDPGIGSTAHMSSELVKLLADIDLKVVHFRGANLAVIDLLGGHSHAMINSIVAVLPHIKSGKLRVLGTGGVKRSAILPDVPTIAEAGLPGFNVTGWYGILAPAGTPVPIVDRLNKEIKTILTSDEAKKRFLNAGMEADYLGSTEFGPFIEGEINRWTSVVKKGNIKLEQ
jgi:tripartite-type tricarboxylate transporter receptor subunit TctC